MAASRRPYATPDKKAKIPKRRMASKSIMGLFLNKCCENSNVIDFPTKKMRAYDFTHRD